MKLFNKTYKQAYNKGMADKEKELFPIHRKNLQDIAAEKDIEIASLRAEISSMQIRTAYWEDVYRKVKTERTQIKIDRKELGQVAEDVFYILNQEIIKNNEVLASMGKVLGKFTNKAIEDKK